MGVSYLKYCLILFFTISTTLHAQKWRFEDFSSKKGLSSSVGKCCIQDSYGFIWIGTEDGLNKFDGYEFTIYKNKNDDSTSIGGRNILSLYEDSNGQLWISTEKGIYIYNRQKDNFSKIHIIDPAANKPFLPKTVDFLELTDKTLLLCSSNGIFRYSKKANQFEYYRFLNTDIYCLALGKDGVVWASTQEKGVISFELNGIYCSNYPFLLTSGLLVKECEVIDLEIDKIGNIWASVGKTLYLLNQTEKKFKPYIQKTTNKSITFNSSIRGLLSDSKNQLWISTDDDGLFVLDYKNNTLEAIVHPDNNNPNFVFSKLLKPYEDNYNNIWVPCISGISMVQMPKYLGFNVIEEDLMKDIKLDLSIVSSLHEDLDGNLWVGTDGNGLYKFNKSKSSFIHFSNDPQKPNTIGSNSVLTIYEDKAGNLWFGGYNGGFYKYNKNSNNFKVFKNNPNNINSLSNDDVRDIYQDENLNLWIATKGGGINIFDQNKNIFRQLRKDDKNTQSLISDYCLKILETYDKNFVLSTYNGFSIYNPTLKKFDNFPTRDNDSNWFGNSSWIIDMQEDEYRNFWMATNDGLFYFNPQKKQVIRFDVSDGLPSSYVCGIKKNKNNLWISGYHGLAKLSLQYTDSVPRITQSINYRSFGNKLTGEFFRGSAYQSNSGILFFGGYRGFTYFNPDSIKLNQKTPHLIFTDFLLYYNHVPIDGKNSPIKQHISIAEEVILKHYQKVITFKFSALNFNSNEKPQYAYYIEGIDKNWINIYDRNELTFTNLEAGKYVLKIKTWSDDGQREIKEVSVKIIVLPPWWATWWFRITVTIAIISLITSFVILRLRFLKNNNKILQEMVSERTMELEIKNQELVYNQDQIEKQKEELRAQKDFLSDMNQQLEDQKDKILKQNNEIENHSNHLEELVIERTKDLGIALSKAEESDRLKTHFLHNMSHEIRTPMNAIMGFSELISETAKNNDELSSYAEVIKNRSSDLLQIIEDIIEISKIESGIVPLHFEVVNLNELFSLLNEFFKGYSLRNNKSDLEFIVHPIPIDIEPVILTDKVKLRQILINLIFNAFKFTFKGKIEVGCKLSANKKITFYVIDTGIGIAENEIPNIFDRFMQIDNISPRSTGGTGLGLAIVKGLSELMDGEIQVESTPGKGSTFTFTIPHKTEKEKPSVLVKEPEDNSVFSNKIVLIVEDDIYNAKYLQTLLMHKGFTILLAETGDEAVRVIESNKSVDIVLMDVRLPGMDGYEATKLLKQIRPEIIVFAQTAYVSTTESQRAVEAGCDEYISKPINRQILFSMMRKHLSKK